MNPLSWKKAQQYNIAVEKQDLYYATTATLEHMLEIASLGSDCIRFTRLTQQQFKEKLERIYQPSAGSAQLIAEDIDNSNDLSVLSDEIPVNEDLLNEQSDAPVIRLINAVLSEALKEQASDIHIEVFEKTMSVRFRVDGVLRQVVQPNKKLAAPIISRIKIMAKLDIAEKRLPQDGRITLKIGNRNVDVRVSTLPSQYGERVVLRLLDKSSLQLSIDRLGMSAEDTSELKHLITRPHGIILVSGPTGSGKTTTLYAILSAINSPQRNILTVEDPIEYELEGIGQTQVNSRVDMSFAKGLRAILRQDPDVVMVGEVRDAETARIAVQASLTGHLVLSTIHTNSAIGAITRLRDMGTESFLLASSLVGVIAQRLVRRLCNQCKKLYSLSVQQQQLLRTEGIAAAQLWQANGCSSCRKSGYQGRMPIHELLVITPEMREAIHSDVNEQQLEQLRRRKHNSLLANGLLAAVQGLTSLEEVLRATSEGQILTGQSE